MTSWIDVRFRLDGVIRKDDEANCFVSYCPGLNIYSAGRDRVTAKEALRCAVDLFIRLCYERQILWRVLKDRGFVKMVHPSRVPISSTNFIAVSEPKPEAPTQYDDIFPLEIPLQMTVDQDAMEVV